MKNKDDEIIYVGKAISLKNRVSQYFVGSHLVKVQAMVNNIFDFDYILCKSEMEALILESNMIKQYMPKYNILLKDDKHYPYVKIDYDKAYPTIEIVRKLKKDGCTYYGPFLNASGVRKAVEYAYELYPVRTCKKDIETNTSDRTCINYEIGRCLGPCARYVEKEEYLQNVKGLAEFLEGKTKTVVDFLTVKMKKYADKLEFEKAQEILEVIKTIQSVIQDQSASASKLFNRDILGIALADEYAIVHQLIMRDGKMVGSNHYKLSFNNNDTPKEILSAFLIQYYDAIEKIPKEILLPFEVDEIVLDFITNISKCKILVPKLGEKRELILMATKNARENIIKLKKDRQWLKTKGAMGRLAGILGIDGNIIRMECYDISHTAGKDSVGAMVVFTNGKPDRGEYRRFNIKSDIGINDYLALEEIVTRRLNRAIEQQREGIEGSFSNLPDLIVIDGGKGQVNCVYEVLQRMHFSAIPIIGLAERHEEVFLPNTSQPIIIDKRDDALKVLQAIRDEAHRFAITFHRSNRNKTNVKSELDEISGIGKVKKEALFKHFKTIENIKKASIEELIEVDKMDKRAAIAVYDYFNKTGSIS